MAECTKPEVGVLLHAYELNALPESEVEQFEMHLLECESCFEELQAFEEQAAILAEDLQVRKLMDEACAEEGERETLFSRIWRYLWPDVPYLFRPAVAYLVALLLIYPAFQGAKKPLPVGIREVPQYVFLTSTRSQGANAFDKSKSDLAILHFAFAEAESGRSYHVTVQFEDSSAVYDEPGFSSFDRQKIGTLSLPLREMTPGRYHLSVAGLDAESRMIRQDYYFRIEK